MHALIDGCGRIIDHLRMSVTSACNLQCLYCRPSNGAAGAAPAERMAPGLSDSQRIELVTWLHERFGLRHVRLTGGEPLLHRTILSLITDMRRAAPDLDIAMTTNGTRLAGMAHDLRRAGLNRLNVSLDCLDPDQFRRLTGGDLHEVLHGLDAACAAGFESPKINTVVLRGVNNSALTEMAGWAFAQGHEIRFLEAMPIGPAGAFNRARFVSAAEMRRSLRAGFELKALPRAAAETAKRYEARGAAGRGVLGIIAPVSEPFCAECRRIRVTADGRLYPCLLDSRYVDLRPAWTDAQWDAAAAERRVRAVIGEKRSAGSAGQRAVMVVLGG